VSDVFISYARSTAAQADRMTDALRGLGYNVWRDDQLPAHLAYGEVIEERLHEAKAVVVIWSADALQSVWVRSEADRARALRKLIQLSVDGSRLPMPFDQIQCADLAGWTGDTGHKGFQKIVESVAHLVTTGEAPVRTWRPPAAAPASVSAAEPPPAQPEAREAAALAPAPPLAAAPPESHVATAPAPQPEVAATASAAVPSSVPPQPEILAATVEAPPPGVGAAVSAAFATPDEPVADPHLAAPAPAAAPEPAELRPDVREDATPVTAASAAPMAPEIHVTAVEPAIAVAVNAAVPRSGEHSPAGGSELRAASAPQPAVATRRSAPRMGLIAAGSGAVVVLIGGGIWLAAGGLTSHRAAPTPSRATYASPTLALAWAPIPTGINDQQVSQAAAALAGDARSAGRPASEVGSLAQLAGRVDALLTQLKSASAHPGGAGEVAALTAQLNQAAAKGAQAEASTLSRASDAMASDARSTLRGDDAPATAGAALAALRDSTQRLHAAAASAAKAADAAGSLASLHTALASWSKVRTDYANATALYPQVLRARFEAAAGGARAAAQRVIAGAGGPRPWLFASSNEKRAYTTRQANAATAKTELAQLEALAQSVATSSRESELKAAIGEAGKFRSSLAALATAPPPSSPNSGG
jgi:hypothetical protein